MGVQTSAETFQFMFDDLAKSLKVYALDYLGFGKSTRKMEYGPTFDVIIDAFAVHGRQGHRQGEPGRPQRRWLVRRPHAYQSPERVNRCVFIGSAGMNVTPVPTVSGYSAPTREQYLESLKSSVCPAPV